MNIVIDFEGFQISKNKYIIKEIAFFNCETGQTMNYFIKSFYFSTKKNIHWVVKNFHNIPINFGSVKLTYFKNIINSFTDSKFFSKGSEKTIFLSTIFGVEFINLETLGCPKYSHIENIFCGFEKHINNNHCALKKVVFYSNWLNGKR
jgi:hypothetical protein